MESVDGGQSKQNEQLHSQTAGGLVPVSEVLDWFWLRNLVGVGEDGIKGIRCIPQSTGFPVLLSPKLSWTPSDAYFFDVSPHVIPGSLTFGKGCNGSLQKKCYKHMTS